jgi:hypothetical protein
MPWPSPNESDSLQLNAVNLPRTPSVSLVSLAKMEGSELDSYKLINTGVTPYMVILSDQTNCLVAYTWYTRTKKEDIDSQRAC